MGPDFNDPKPSYANPEPPAAPLTPSFDWRHWARRLLVCNPFFLCSAALLLFGVNRLSVDPNFLGDEKGNLLFNYFALQFYELLVITTAILLARRRIWYDSALLVVVEHGLLLVPFMLISQGTLLNNALGIKLAIGAFTFAIVRAVFIRRCYSRFNLPLRALGFGAVLLLLNAALPALFPSVVEKDTDNWITPNLVLWYVFMPVLVGGANLLPRPARYGGLGPERHWLPLFIYALWIAGTGAHVWCLGYICKIEFEVRFLGPAAVLAAWTLWHRIGDCVPNPVPRWEFVTLCGTFVSPLVAFADSKLFEALVILNLTAYVVLFFRRTGTRRALLRELMFASGAFLMLGLPEDIGRILLPAFTGMHAAILSLATMICLAALRWFRVRLGIAGALAATTIAAVVWPRATTDVLVQIGAVFLLAHSLGWRNQKPGATILRGLAGGIWIVDAAFWIHEARWQTDAAITSAAIALLAAWFLLWWITGRRRDWMVFASACGVILVAPLDWLIVQHSRGLLALVASVALFAAGIVVAWTRHAWDHKSAAAP